MILFRERGRKAAPAPDGVALLTHALAWHTRNPRHVSPARLCAYAHAIYSLISE